MNFSGVGKTDWEIRTGLEYGIGCFNVESVPELEIINELEPSARGPYGGAVGYVSNTGNLDLAITIRTLVIENDRIAIQAGAGIVYDSDPGKEYEETINKAAAVFKALQLTANGLSL